MKHQNTRNNRLHLYQQKTQEELNNYQYNLRYRNKLDSLVGERYDPMRYKTYTTWQWKKYQPEKYIHGDVKFGEEEWTKIPASHYEYKGQIIYPKPNKYNQYEEPTEHKERIGWNIGTQWIIEFKYPRSIQQQIKNEIIKQQIKYKKFIKHMKMISSEPYYVGNETYNQTRPSYNVLEKWNVEFKVGVNHPQILAMFPYTFKAQLLGGYNDELTQINANYNKYIYQ